MSEVNYDELDVGIRDVVRLLNDHGFETTDSGDGVSKPKDWYESGEAMPFPNVAATTTLDRFIEDADRMQVVLGEAWTVEATYAPRSGIFLFASRQATR